MKKPFTADSKSIHHKELNITVQFQSSSNCSSSNFFKSAIE